MIDPDETLGMVQIERGNLQALYDIAVHSMDFGSGFLVDEEVEQLRAVAVLLGQDPMEATPSDFKKKYPHPFKVYEPPQGWGLALPERRPCYYCSALSADPIHNLVEAPACVADARADLDSGVLGCP